jgi:hypothetical protein
MSPCVRARSTLLGVALSVVTLTGCARHPAAPDSPESVARPLVTVTGATAATTEDDALLEAIAAEGEMLLAEVDLAWNRNVALRSGPPDRRPAGLIVPCESWAQRAQAATSTVGANGQQLDRALVRRDVSGAQRAVQQLGAVVPPAVTIIVTYLDCLEQGGGGRNGGPPGEPLR